MPWTAKDAEGHTKKADTPKKQKTWAKIANDALKRCTDGGESTKVCEGRAVRIANDAVAKIGENVARGYFTSGTATVEISALDVDGEKVSVSELVAAYLEQDDEQADTCTCSECKAGIDCDVTKCPECGAAISDEEEETATSEVAEVGKLRELLEQALALLGEQAEDVAEIQLSESASGHAISLAETQAVTGGPRAPLLMDVALITPGWGNKKDNHYYSRELLARDAKVFEGVKMYTADHKPDQKSVRTEVSVIKEITGFTDSGAPIASVAVHDPDFAEATRNRAKLGTLDSLECSILAGGRVRKGKIGDRKGKIVEAITSADSVDWVTKAGAGGHAIALAESNTGGVNMEKDQVKRLLSESDLPQDVQERLAGVEYESEEAVKEAILAEAEAGADDKPKPVVYLAEAEIKTLLEASRLPQQAQSKLAEAQYLDAEALKTAVEAERVYIKELTGSGKPFAQGDTAPAAMSEADYDAGIDDIFERHGVSVPQREVT